MKTADPKRGVRKAPDKTMEAPSGPPIQFHQGVALIKATEGKGGRKTQIANSAVSIVPQIEKKAA